ncbi:uncharacterized protein H6S33_008905 [Morchella sextelata]|uniref:uncharacterized protein n=1 Tax=Morchella sextelata TaxID=1174677 RepID=UPI001D04EDBE|nr:uncharacterized protein H6S33_008905 [Morchella sextelata]KAH0612525.1 hypothetical protein H6S33_008905 [Morchella sextelata]
MPPAIPPGLNPLQIYRQTSLGTSLADSIDTLIQRSAMTEAAANMLMQHFDRAMTARLTTDLKSTISINGKIENYRFCDDIWSFTISDAAVRISRAGGPREKDSVYVNGQIKLTAWNGVPVLAAAVEEDEGGGRGRSKGKGRGKGKGRARGGKGKE